VSLTGFAVALSVLAVVSLVGNQALFAANEHVDRREWVPAIRDARHAHALLPWSFEPLVALGDARAGAGDRAGALGAYREAAATDHENWTVWLRLAQLARGKERTRAYARVHELNPLDKDLPGESTPGG
jgi:hypothetical protein